MADIDIETTISDVKLFLEKLKSSLPEVFEQKDTSPENGDEVKTPSAGKVLYMGDLLETEVSLDVSRPTPEVKLEDKKFIVTITNLQEETSLLIEAFIRNKAVEILPIRVKEIAQIMGVEFGNISIKDQKTLWGSCSGKKNLNFSYRIIKMPKIVIDYLIIHELAHLVHFDHSADFWATVGHYSPDFKQHRKWLNNNKYAVMSDVNVKYTPKEG